MRWRWQLHEELNNCSNNYNEFESIFVKVLDSYAPKKMKIVRGNHKPHITKQLRKAIMKRSQLKNKANKTKAPDDFASYKKQRNLVVRLNKEAKHTFFDSLDTSKDYPNLFGIIVNHTLAIRVVRMSTTSCC